MLYNEIVLLSPSMSEASRDNSSMAESLSDEYTVVDLNITAAGIDTAGMDVIDADSLTPLIKEELRYAIQCKRLSQGKDELSLSDEEEEEKTPTVEMKEVTPEEEERRRRRRERNKLAARRCRNRKREQTEVLEEETSKLEARNKALRQTINELEDEREKLREMLYSHQHSCVLADRQVAS